MRAEGHLQSGGEEFWSVRSVASTTGLARASIYRYSAWNLFPQPRRIGPGRVAWLATEVLTWMKSHLCRPDWTRSS
jgi:predicted DNA-binding transcriptional regulator AlpA